MQPPTFAVVEVYDSLTDRWARVADMPTSRWGATASVADGKIYVIGGADAETATAVSEVAEYDPATDVWTIRAPLPRGRSVLASSTIGSRIYAVGGCFFAQPPHPATVASEVYSPLPDGPGSQDINYGLAGGWFNPLTPGQGFLFDRGNQTAGRRDLFGNQRGGNVTAEGTDPQRPRNQTASGEPSRPPMETPSSGKNG